MSIRTMLVIAVLLLSSGCAVSAPPTRVLMHVGGRSHDYEQLPRQLAERLGGRGELKVDLATDASSLTREKLADYKALVINNCEKNAPPEGVRNAIRGFVESGRGLVAMHCALWSFQDWPEWSSLVGGFVPGHGSYGMFPCVVLDPAHATVMGVGGRFDITDEPYVLDRRGADINVLVRTAGVIKVANGTREGPEPQVWTRREGKGRVFALTFGHDDKSQLDERFLTILHNGIRWAAGDLGDTRHNLLTAAEESEGFRLLFNGRNLDGWTGDVERWSVKDGELVGQTDGKLPHNQFLIHREEFGDFLLKYSVRIRNHNSGVQIRSRAFPEHVVKGYQVDIADGWYGSLYEEGGKRGVLVNGFKGKGDAVAILDGWNDMTVRAVGPRITITLNGVKTVEYEEKEPGVQPDKGVIALQLHAGPPMEVRFRDLRIRPLTGDAKE